MPAADRERLLLRLSLKIGLRNGLLIGLALALGSWSLDILFLSSSHVRSVFPPLILGLLALMALGGATGWLAARWGNAFGGGMIWALAGVGMTWIVGHLPYEGRTLAAWLADRRFWGLPIYDFEPAAQARLVMAGFFVVLLLAVLGLVQDYRLEIIRLRVDDRDRLEVGGWLGLLLPLPLVFAVGLAADNLVNSPLRTAPRLVHQAIQVGRTYPGDLFELSLEEGVNYNAIAGVRDQMSVSYELSVAQIDLGPSSTVFVTALFDNGAWITCRVVADQLSHCYDASAPYVRGFSGLLTSGETPSDCRSCMVRASRAWREWLLERGERWAGAPHIRRLAQKGSYVFMRATASNETSGVECLFQGISPVKLTSCSTVALKN